MIDQTLGHYRIPIESAPIALPIDRIIQPAQTSRQYDIMPDGKHCVPVKN
jgi:hypothetical protein